MPADTGVLHVKLGMGALQSDSSVPVLVLELTARGPAKEKDNPEARQRWFATAHEWIVRGFADLIDEDIQTRVWRRE
jgi:hypothetical protein